jgi:predicted amidophosphoribosyltransferase
VDLVCPACTASELSFDGEFTFVCAYCGTTLVAGGIECPACGLKNSKAAEFCTNCSEPLSIVASIMDRQGYLGPPLWVRRLQSQVGELKRSEAQASDERFAAFQDIDRRRIQAESIAQASQEHKDRNIIFYGLVAILAAALLALVALVLF